MSSEEEFCNSTYADQIHNAELELSAFMCSVTQLFGCTEAQRSAQDWLDELESIEILPISTSRTWRAVTIAASARLANRLAVAQQRGSDRRVDARVGRRFAREPRAVTSGIKPL